MSTGRVGCQCVRRLAALAEARRISQSSNNHITVEVDRKTVEVELVPGNTLLLYTDGITEAANAEEFGESCLLDTRASHAHLPAGSVLQAVVGAVQQFSSASEQQDDITLVIARSLA